MTTFVKDDSGHERRLNEVLLAYVEAAEAGRAPEPKQVLDAHPDLSADLREFFAGREQIERMLAPLREQAREEPTHIRPSASDANGAKKAVPSNGAGAELGLLGDFQLLREVGRGGMGIVYEAEQISLRRRVALKVLPFAAAIDPRQLQRFRNEAMAAAHLRHENIVPVFAVGAERGVHYYAMQFIDGQSLAVLIAELRRLAGEQPLGADKTPGAGEPTDKSLLAAPAEEAQGATDRLVARSISRERSGQARKHFNWIANLGRQAALALEHAHQMGIVHRDVKPANLLLDPRGQLWVADFGLARVAGDDNLTLTGELLGTLRYASPEQALGKPGLLDHRSDVYSLGATLYELLLLKPLFDGADRRELLRQIAEEEPALPRSFNRAIPAELETIVLKALAKEPGDRYASARELADDLDRYLQDQPIRSRRPSALEKATKWGRRHRTLVMSVLAALVFASAGLSIATLLTARAYDGERKKAAEANEQRTRAEENFRQAWQAVDQFAQIGEEELAGQPRLEGVRQRLLEAALVYYQDFIKQRREDPAAKAQLVTTQERVMKILSDLAVLQGAGQLGLLREPAVLDDLELTAAQRANIEDLSNRLDKQWMTFPDFGKLTLDQRQQQFVDLARTNDTELRRILSADQVKRLRQIALQLQGVQAFRETEVAAALKLTMEERERIQAIIEETFFWGPGGPRPLSPMGINLAMERVVDLLTPEQARRWQEMIGKPYLGPIYPPFGPPPAPREGELGR